MMDLSMYMKACDLQVIASLLPLIRFLKTRRTSGFSTDSQLLYILAFSLKYLHYPLTKLDNSADLITTHVIHYYIRIVLFIVMALTFVITVNVTGYFVSETDRSWLFGGTIASFILAADFTTYDRSRFTTITCIFGSYVDVISWIPQFKLTLKRMQIDEWVLVYIIGLFTYDFISMSNTTQDYYKNFVYSDIRFKHSLLKFVLFCGFLLKYFRRQLTIRVESMNDINCESSIANEVIIVSSAEEYSDKMLFRTLGMEDVLVHRRLMSPY